MKLQWYQKIYDESQKGFKHLDHIHGSLIALGELLRNTGDFCTPKFRDICDAMLKYRDHKDRHVKKTGMPLQLLIACYLTIFLVLFLLPRLGSYSPDLFVHNYLNTCMNHILSALRNQNDRAVAFISLGEIAVAVGGSIFFILDQHNSLIIIIHQTILRIYCCYD